ncbi:MAG TPA: hypothetical protein VFP52_08305 [Myxococcales bacterium]|nr:hypothetical protein [Myxococcales bacterium]
MPTAKPAPTARRATRSSWTAWALDAAAFSTSVTAALGCAGSV